jgi:hypothetical protein
MKRVRAKTIKSQLRDKRLVHLLRVLSLPLKEVKRRNLQ